MGKPFAVFDIDGTIFRSSLFLEITYTLADMGVIQLPKDGAHVKTLESWRSREESGSYNEYVLTLVTILENQLEGIKVKDLEEAANRVIEEQVKHTYVYPRLLIERLRNEGYFLIAISGSQIELVERFASHWGFDDWIGQYFERENGVLTGGRHKTHEYKGRFLEEMIKKHDLDLKGSYGIGDSLGDTDLLKMTENPIAFNPERKLLEKAKERGWKIVVERKSVIYKLEVGDDGKHYMAETI